MTKKEFTFEEPWFKIKGVAGKLKYDNPYGCTIATQGFGRIVDENGSVFGRIIFMNRFGFTFMTNEEVSYTISFSDFPLA